jgi:hypothetical protein
MRTWAIRDIGRIHDLYQSSLTGFIHARTFVLARQKVLHRLN